MKPTIVFAGSVAQKLDQGGHTWVFLQYLLGFRRLGCDVLFLDRLEPEMCVDEGGALCPVDTSTSLAYLRRVMTSFSLDDSFSVSVDRGERFIGLSRAQVRKRVADATTLINVMGYFNDPDILSAARQRVFLDIDPGFGQMWHALGLHDPYVLYDHYVTVGENVGRPGCAVPDCGLTWKTTRQPIVLAQWPVSAPAPASPFTSIGAWRGPFAPIEYQGITYGLRAHEFRRFLQLPRLTQESFEVALDIHPAETTDLKRLAEQGWRLADPRQVAADPAAYRTYIAQSKAEFMVAKNMYVETQSGWFSDRSICYLASGKPVLAQDTGLASLYPLGRGLVCFSTLEEAVAGVEEISNHYESHCRAAREIAEQYFDSDKVLTRLLETVGVA